jgi:hydrogenase maturation factor
MLLPLGKLPPDLMRDLLGRLAPTDPAVLVGPGPGLDCAVLDIGDQLLVLKSDPITFATASIGRYAVTINANDVAVFGAQPRWFLATVFLAPGRTDSEAKALLVDIQSTCQALGAELIGGHTEVTAGLDRPIVAGTMIGVVDRTRLITPRGAQPGDVLLLTKGIPLEAASVLARDHARHFEHLRPETLEVARGYLDRPGLSVVAEALAAADTGAVTAMHDPTEGGLVGALWELSEAAGVALQIDLDAIPILPEAADICRAAGMDPLSSLASGALLITTRPEGAQAVLGAVSRAGIAINRIGSVVAGEGVAMRKEENEVLAPRPSRDALAVWLEGQRM